MTLGSLDLNARTRDPQIGKRLATWIRMPGRPGVRYSPGQAADAICQALEAPGLLTDKVVLHWIAKGWLKASKHRYGYRIRRRAIRRALADIGQVSLAIMKAAQRHATRPPQQPIPRETTP